MSIDSMQANIIHLIWAGVVIYCWTTTPSVVTTIETQGGNSIDIEWNWFKVATLKIAI